MQTKKYNENLSELLELAKKGDKKALECIVEENIGLVHSIVRRFSGRGYETEDLFQIGSMGLVKAVKKFDSTFDVKFSTYAVPMIMGEIKRFIRDDGIIKVSRSIKELAVRALGVRDAILKETNAEPSVKEIAKRINETPEDVALALDACLKPESLFSSLGDDANDGKILADKIESSENCEETVVNKVLVQDLLSEFTERERKIIILRYFKQKTQAEIAAMLCVSQVQVSRIEKNVIAKMREKIMKDNELCL